MQKIAAGEVFSKSHEIVAFLQSKFKENDFPKYLITEIEESSLSNERDANHRKLYKTIEGSSNFQVMIFVPHSNTFKASTRLCLCDRCNTE